MEKDSRLSEKLGKFSLSSILPYTVDVEHYNCMINICESKLSTFAT